MTSYTRLRELLPSLYRPELDDQTLLNRLLAATGFVMDGAAVQTQHVLRGHWFDVADHAVWDAHYQTERRERGLPAANVRAPKDLKEILRYPYIADLARACALLGLPPWREPASLRETVEEYRQRIADVLDAYRLGLTTLAALRRLVEAALPEDMSAALAQQRWPFAIEQPVALQRSRQQIVVPDAKEGDLLSPLYYWEHDQAPGPPVVYLQGVTASGELIGPTAQPAIECFTPDATPAGIALAYRGTLAPDQTLRLSPARRSWLAVDGTLQASPAETVSNAAQDPSANGPFQVVSGAPAGSVRALATAADNSVWLVIENAGTWSLHRYDGTQFVDVAAGAPAGPYRALQARGAAIYLATQQGLFRCSLFPQVPPFALTAVAAVPEALHGCAVLPDGQLACAGDDGLALLAADDSLVQRLLLGTPLRAVHAADDRVYVSTAQALLQLDHGRWFRYEGAALSENLVDWEPIEPGVIGAAQSPLPTVLVMTTTDDGSLWLGTTRGLARYYAREARTTLLEAFSDLGEGALSALRVDDRGMLWAAGATGLFRYDGDDLAQYDFAQSRWHRLGRAAVQYPDEISEQPRSHWRFQSAQDRWERYDPAQRRFADPGLASRALNGPAVAAVLLNDSVRAELGQFDGTNFGNAQPVALGELALRVKPDETRIVDGGLPALPRGGGLTRWRYLQLEPSGLTPPASGRPWWSREGRLFPLPLDSAKLPAHFRSETSAWHADGHYAAAVYAYAPSAKLWMEYPLAPVIGVRVRLFKRAPDESVDPALIERVWTMLVRAKAAGVPMQLAVEGTVVEGE